MSWIKSLFARFYSCPLCEHRSKLLNLIAGPMLSLELTKHTKGEIASAVYESAAIPGDIKSGVVITLWNRCGRSNRLTLYDAIGMIENRVAMLKKTGEL